LLCSPIRWEYCRTIVDATIELERYKHACETHKLVCTAAREDFDRVIQELCEEVSGMAEPNDVYGELKHRIFPLIAQGCLREAVAIFAADFNILVQAYEARAEDDKEVEGEEGEMTEKGSEVGRGTTGPILDTSSSSPLSVRVDHQLDRGKVVLTLQGELPGSTGMRVRYDLNIAYWDRLCSRLRGPAEKQAVGIAIWRLLHRYQTLFGPSGEGRGWQLACPPAVMGVLAMRFGCNCELFASPFNAQLPEFFSLYADTDACFGSLGSFFAPSAMDHLSWERLAPGGRSMECNPPFEESIMARAVKRVIAVLDRLEDNAATLPAGTLPPPFSVTFILPFWARSEAIRAARQSNFFRRELVVGQSPQPSGDERGIAMSQHSYLDGFQHLCDAKRRKKVLYSKRASLMIWLQNEPGTVRWPTSESVLTEVRTAWEIFET
jgi:hypothetical protein